MANKPLITITAEAGQHIAGIMAREQGKMLRISVSTKGCAGHKYVYELVDQADISQRDEIVTGDWGQVAVDANSILYLLGSTLNLRSDSLQSQLVWHNPMASATCGCGDSFSIGKEDACQRPRSQ